MDLEGHNVLVTGASRGIGRATAELMALTEVNFDEWKGAWERTLAGNLLGPARLSFLVGLRMVEQGAGRIVDVDGVSYSRS